MGKMNSEVFARVVARLQGRAFPTRATSAISPDPPCVFAVAPIQVVAEQHLQAIAYGDPEGEPRVITLWNPLDCEADALEPFAAALDDYLTSSLAGGQLPRVWVAHASALKLLGLLGEHYRRNAQASGTIRRLGGLCRALAAEQKFAGQQVIAVALDLLRSHVVTGQSPAEEEHLGALLAWVNPEVGEDPASVADWRALRPAAAMLDRESDDRVEELRRTAKAEGPEAAAARAEIEARLLAGALNEWGLLLEARAAFRGLGLPPMPRLDGLKAKSARRIEGAITKVKAWPADETGQADRHGSDQ